MLLEPGESGQSTDAEPVDAGALDGASQGHIDLEGVDSALPMRPTGSSVDEIYHGQTGARHLEREDNGRLAFRTLSYTELRERQDVLRFGKRRADGEFPEPFRFLLPEGRVEHAENSGLEGFLFTELKLRSVFGLSALRHHTDNYFDYLSNALEDIQWASDVRRAIETFREEPMDPEQKYLQLIQFTTRYVEGLREVVRENDGAHWLKRSKVYSFFPRQFNLEGFRDARGLEEPTSPRFFEAVNEADLELIKHESGCDTIWVMGIYPIGERGRLGDAGGSPFSIADYGEISPELGDAASFVKFVRMAHEAGLKVIVDLVPNHTSMDAALLKDDPTLYIHQVAGEHDEVPDGYFEHVHEGQRYFIAHGGYFAYDQPAWFRDTAQLDYSNPHTRDAMIQAADEIASRYDIDGFRIDMAYGLTNQYFSKRWEVDMPEEEFLTEFHRTLKRRHPHLATTLEGYDLWDKMSESGADSIYGKNNIQRRGGSVHTGYYDALVGRDIPDLKRALLRAEFLRYQSAGPNALMFDGNHDEPANVTQFGDFWKTAAVMTQMIPGSTLFLAGQEVGNDQAIPEIEGDRKPLPFQIDSKIDWNAKNQDVRDFYANLRSLVKQAHEVDGCVMMRVIPETLKDRTHWIGFELHTGSEENPHYRVVANPTTDTIVYSMKAPGRNEPLSGELPPNGFSILKLDGKGVEEVFTR